VVGIHLFQNIITANSLCCLAENYFSLIDESIEQGKEVNQFANNQVGLEELQEKLAG